MLLCACGFCPIYQLEKGRDAEPCWVLSMLVQQNWVPLLEAVLECKM